MCANASLLHKGNPCSGPALGKCLDCSVEYFGRAYGPVAVLGVAASKRLLRRKAAATHSVSQFVHDTVVPNVLKDRSAEVPSVVIPSFRADDEDETGSAPAQLPDEPFILFVVHSAQRLGTLFGRLPAARRPPPLVLMGTFEQETRRSQPGSSPWEGRACRCHGHLGSSVVWGHALALARTVRIGGPRGDEPGRAVIGTTPGGHSDMIDNGQNGLLVPAGNVAALRDAMRQLLDDPNHRDQLGKAAQQKAHQFTASSVVPQMERVYGELTNGARAHVHAH